MSLESLSNQLLLQTLEYVVSEKSHDGLHVVRDVKRVASIALCSKTINALATPMLYSSFTEPVQSESILPLWL